MVSGLFAGANHRVVPPEMMFREYAYFSSFSDTMVRHARTIAESLTDRCQLHGGSLVVEVASNDGYLLQWYQRAGGPCWESNPLATSLAWPKSKKECRPSANFLAANWPINS